MAGKFYKDFFPQRMEHCPRPLASLLSMGNDGNGHDQADLPDPNFVSFIQLLLQLSPEKRLTPSQVAIPLIQS
jgi:hypothetical protein